MPMVSMQAPNSAQTAVQAVASVVPRVVISNQSEFNNIVATAMAPIADPIPVEKGFGEKFDFVEALKTENMSCAAYKKRLLAFKHYLFDYVSGFERLAGAQPEPSGCSVRFLKEYLHKVAVIKATAAALPTICNPFNNNQLEIIRTYIPERATHLIPGMRWNSEYGQVAIFPHIEVQNGVVHFSTKVPVFLITEPDAESIALSVSLLNTKKLSAEDKINRAIGFLNDAKQTSKQAYSILNNFLFQACGEKLDEIINARKQKAKTLAPLAEEDGKVFLKCKNLCPHLLRLSILEHQILNCRREFLRRCNNGAIIFEPKEGELFKELYKYIAVIDQIDNEYSIIYKRINEELKNLKASTKPTLETKKETNTSSAQEILPTETKEFHSTPNSVNAPVNNPLMAASSSSTQAAAAASSVSIAPHIKLKYAKRVTRWFREGFTRTIQDNSKILYHALLPCIADSIVINHGQKSVYKNKTHRGQTDDLYTIAGKIINEATQEECHCIFNICIDPRGTCYHRGFKKCTWENLGPEFQASTTVEDEQYQDDEEPVEVTDNKPAIIQESRFSATVINPKYGYKIVLFKGV